MTPAENKDTKLSIVESASLAAPPFIPSQAEAPQPEVKKGISLAGVGEAAIGTAGVMLLKDQLFDKDHRIQLQQQISHLLKQQNLIARQLQELTRKMDMLSKGNKDSSWAEKLLL